MMCTIQDTLPTLPSGAEWVIVHPLKLDSCSYECTTQYFYDGKLVGHYPEFLNFYITHLICSSTPIPFDYLLTKFSTNFVHFSASVFIRDVLRNVRPRPRSSGMLFDTEEDWRSQLRRRATQASLSDKWASLNWSTHPSTIEELEKELKERLNLASGNHLRKSVVNKWFNDAKRSIRFDPIVEL